MRMPEIISNIRKNPDDICQIMSFARIPVRSLLRGIVHVKLGFATMVAAPCVRLRKLHSSAVIVLLFGVHVSTGIVLAGAKQPVIPLILNKRAVTRY